MLRISALISALALLGLVLTPFAIAANVPVTVFADKSIHLEVPTGWKQALDLFGAPLTWLGPQHGEFRPVLTLFQAPRADLEFNPGELKRGEADYREGREAWLKKMGAQLVRFIPYRHEKTSAAEIHSIGLRYKINGQEFIEESNYIVCGQGLYHLKSLVPAQQEAELGPLMALAAKSFSCAR